MAALMKENYNLNGHAVRKELRKERKWKEWNTYFSEYLWNCGGNCLLEKWSKNMAAKIHGPEFGESSRFSVLANNDSEESQEENDGHKIDEAKKKAKNAKKRARKKKKAAEDSAATAEV